MFDVNEERKKLQNSAREPQTADTNKSLRKALARALGKIDQMCVAQQRLQDECEVNRNVAFRNGQIDGLHIALIKSKRIGRDTDMTEAERCGALECAIAIADEIRARGG